MINPVLERRYEDCSELLEAWSAYHDVFSNTISSETPDVSPDAEQNFLNIKAKIAMLHDSFLESIKYDQNVAQNMLEIVNRSITLRHVVRMGDADKNKIKTEWHDCYLLLHETVSSINEEREKIADIKEFNHKMGKIQDTIKANVVWFLKSAYFKVIVAVVILAAILLFTPMSAWNQLRTLPGVGPPFMKIQDQLRVVFDLDMPYSSMEQYIAEKLDADSVAEGYATEADASGDKDIDSAGFSSLFDVSDQNAGDFLKTADSYQKYIVTIEEYALDVVALIYFWEQPGSPKRFVREADTYARGTDQNAQFVATQYVFHEDENVLVILQNGPTSDREEVRDRVFKY